MFRKMFLVVAAALLVCGSAFANSVGITYQQIIDDRAFGVTADYTTELTERVTFEADAQLQAGDIINANIQTDFVFDVAQVDLRLLVANKLKGYSFNTLGRSQEIGLAFTVPVENLQFDIGVGGVNSSPFNAPNAVDTLTAAGFDERDLEGKGLDTLTPALKGIPFKNGSAVNAFITTGFKVGIFDADVRGALELLGEGDKMHQVNVNLKTSGKVYDALVTTGLEIGLASYQDEIHYETAIVTTLGFDF